MRVLPTCLLLVCLSLLSPALAAAQSQGGSLARAAEELRSDPVYVDPDAERALTSDEAQRLRDQIRNAKAGPIRVAILPESAKDEAGGDASAAAREIAGAVGEPGTYAVIVGESFRAGDTGDLPVSQLASEALQAKRSDGTAAVLSDFVDRVGEAQRGGSSPGGREPGGGGGGSGLFLLVLLAIPLVLFGLSRRRRRRQESEDLAEVKEFARDDLVALGDDIRALDLDVEMPSASSEAKQHYGRSVECYQAADEAWDAARRVEDMERVSSLLEEGRYEMTAAKAALAGEPIPEHRAPCFFDPRHGPSTTDAEWAPPGGSPREVPVCAADAQRIADGYEPDARQVAIGGQSMPYWNAGPAYGPWAGGFFGGGLLPGLFVGSMLGGAMFGGWGSDAYGADPGAEGFGGGDFGGGDFGGGGTSAGAATSRAAL